MSTGLFLNLGAAAALLVGCTDSTPETDQARAKPSPKAARLEACQPSIVHSGWSTIGPGTREEEVRAASAAVSKHRPRMRAPDRTSVLDGVRTDLWFHGATQLTREVPCKQPPREQYTTEYTVIEMRSDQAENVITCRVLSRTFNSAVPQPDPLGTAGLLEFYSEDLACKEWLKSHGHVERQPAP